MIHVAFFCLCLTSGLAASSSLRTLDRRLDCNQQGLDNCKINNCSDKNTVVKREFAPTGPDWVSDNVGLWVDKHGVFSVMNVTWRLQPNGGVLNLSGTVINILDKSTNQRICVQYSFKIRKTQNPKHERWTFSLDGVVVEPGHTYDVSLFNLPEPHLGSYEITKQITIPGCEYKRIQRSQACLQNGSLWDPNMITNLSVDKENKMLNVVVGFKAAQYSETYKVSIQSPDFYHSKHVSKENRTFLNVEFEFGLWQLLQCEILIVIQPFFIRCTSDCLRANKTINYCPYYPPRTLIIKAGVGLLLIGSFLGYLLWRASHKDPVNTSSSVAKEQSESFQVQERKRVLIIYSLDHPLYKNIILKLCAFLVTKCGTEVVLDLLDFTRLGVLGSIQWLDWHREQVESSADKILILCSRGVQAKWRAMCGDKQVFLREDARSPVGDMLSPALTLIVPHFIRSVSFEKYIVAYFDDVCSEEDVPSPFNITVRYKLMKQFEELFFRILDIEKHEPGRVNHIEGLSEDEYHQCPSGGALRDAIEAFHAYQLERPQWFEDELLESSELEEATARIYADVETTTNLITHCVPESTQVINHVNTQEGDFTVDRAGLNVPEEFQTCASVEFNPLIVE